jgi:hypothetical protein
MWLTVAVAVAATLIPGDVSSSPATAGPAPKARDYAELIVQLEELQDTIAALEKLTTPTRAKQGDEGWDNECRNYSPEKTVRCAATKFRPPGGVDMALSVWRCESNFGTESPHSDPYHGPFQYMTGTYSGQQSMMPDVVRWNELSAEVHDMRSNIMTAVAWAARHDWGPWGCA